MAKILVISGHPHLDQSLANQTILTELKNSGLDITIEDLSEIGWDFDIEAERKAVVDADTLVFEFPLYWYSYPALLKKWVEEVLTHGFAYGTGEQLCRERISSFPAPLAARKNPTAMKARRTIRSANSSSTSTSSQHSPA